MQKFFFLKGILLGIAFNCFLPAFMQAENSENAVVETPNAVFLSAQTAQMSGDNTKALELYQKRVNMGDNREEIFWSFIKMAKIQEHLNMPLQTVEASYELAFACCPNRAESLYYLGSYYRLKTENDKSTRILNVALTIPPPKDAFYVEHWIYEWAALFEYSVTTYWSGFYKESLEACDKILALVSVPQHIREQTLRNRNFALDKWTAQEIKEGRK